MTRFHADLAEILEVPVASLRPDLPLAEHGWDSLAIISCVAMIDELFGTLVPGVALAGCETVGDIERLIPQPVPA